MSAENIAELKAMISEHLNNCEPITMPTICKMKETSKGRSEIEQKILKRIMETGQSVGQVIFDIEREFNPNFIED